ncbi:hypothetical protein SE1039_00620 [Staphylococcus equorum]|nr:hypothetical protein SE1039_00620 [Staphylococcus equorum]
MKWFLFLIQTILTILLALFAYQQMNQKYLDTWFSFYLLFFILFLFWNNRDKKR